MGQFDLTPAHEVEMNGEAVLFLRDCNGILIELIEKADI